MTTQDDIDKMQQDLDDLRISEARAWELATRLREVLEMVEWAECNSIVRCPWCLAIWEIRDITRHHESDCPRQAVLFPPEPEVQG